MNSDEQRADRWERIAQSLRPEITPRGRLYRDARRGSHVCRYCGASEAMPGHEC